MPPVVEAENDVRPPAGVSAIAVQHGTTSQANRLKIPRDHCVEPQPRQLWCVRDRLDDRQR